MVSFDAVLAGFSASTYREGRSLNNLVGIPPGATLLKMFKRVIGAGVSGLSSKKKKEADLLSIRVHQ